MCFEGGLERDQVRSRPDIKWERVPYCGGCKRERPITTSFTIEYRDCVGNITGGAKDTSRIVILNQSRQVFGGTVCGDFVAETSNLVGDPMSNGKPMKFLQS